MKLNTPRWWYRRKPDYARVARLLLRPFGVIWAAATARRLTRTKAVTVGASVISVGNRTVGGSGKTPVARGVHLDRAGQPTAITARQGVG
ncbi:MAG: tetraacyldisaccharide 4'-kinase, partial [Brevundimonas sp.]